MVSPIIRGAVVVSIFAAIFILSEKKSLPEKQHAATDKEPTATCEVLAESSEFSPVDLQRCLSEPIYKEAIEEQVSWIVGAILDAQAFPELRDNLRKRISHTNSQDFRSFFDVPPPVREELASIILDDSESKSATLSFPASLQGLYLEEGDPFEYSLAFSVEENGSRNTNELDAMVFIDTDLLNEYEKAAIARACNVRCDGVVFVEKMAKPDNNWSSYQLIGIDLLKICTDIEQTGFDCFDGQRWSKS